MASVLEVYPSDALLWLEFGGIYTDSAGNRVIDNLATRGDAPATVTCGAGAACPTQLSGKRGVVFAGAQYIDCGLIDRFERTDAFALFCAVQSAENVNFEYMGNCDEAQNYRGVLVNWLSSTTLQALIGNSNSTNFIYAYAASPERRSFHSVCVTYSGSSTLAGLSYYANGAAKTITPMGDNLSATIKSGKPFILGARHNGVAKSSFLTGTMRFAAIFPLAATATQVNSLHKRVLRRINLP